MNLHHARTLTAILGFLLAASAGLARAQEAGLPLMLTGRIVFGFADYAEGHHSEGGPAVTLESDLIGYWRDPRILEYEFKPVITVGQIVPGTEMGNALTGFAAVGRILGGSQFPLYVSYSKSHSSTSETGNGNFLNQGVLTGVQIGTTNTVLDANWMLRFRHLPVVTLDYRDTDNSSELPAEFGGANDQRLRNFSGHINYNAWGWQLAGHYQRTNSTVTSPNLFFGGIEHDSNDGTSIGFSVSRSLPLHSNLGINADQTKSNFGFDDQALNTRVRVAGATFSSQPIKRVTTTVQGQYTNNLQDYQLQQALAATGVTGTPNPALTGPAGLPLSFLGVPFKLYTLSGGVGIQVGYGFSLSGNIGESHSSNAAKSSQWSAGPSYQHSWRSGSMAASYSHSRIAMRTDVAGLIPGGVNPPQFTTGYPLSWSTDLDTVAMDLSQSLPDAFKLSGSAHVSKGTLYENGIPLPDHDYGGFVSLTRPVGEWTLTGSFTLDKNSVDRELIHNESTTKGVSLGAGYRGLALFATFQYGNGLAMQLGNNLLFISHPQVILPVLNAPVLSSTSGRIFTGSYHSRTTRLMVRGYWGHFDYTTNNLPATSYTLLNFNGSYRLRRLRLIAGYVKQSQLFNVGTPGLFDTRLIYFQIERNFRIF